MGEMIEALPTCAPLGGRPKYPPVRYGDYPMDGSTRTITIERRGGPGGGLTRRIDCANVKSEPSPSRPTAPQSWDCGAPRGQ